ncbi:unnamed protein product [Caenorhabditis auriculariae]|uniref:Partial AB-hydrolase lipase domain-containing protein n=1 Tax=Caenorhabditis auriculariae TaxID=2777116 RepID=A0A8S1HUS0_9PELO|nr:unnamed protein product [Caenorhabditis auriculariae]
MMFAVVIFLLLHSSSLTRETSSEESSTPRSMADDSLSTTPAFTLRQLGVFGAPPNLLAPAPFSPFTMGGSLKPLVPVTEAPFARTMPPAYTFPTFPTISFPTLPPPVNATMKPINITIDPEALMDVPEIISHWGYPVETHKVATSDGYILTVHRIPHGKKNRGTKREQRPVIFLQHGLLCTSSIWLLNLPHQSAGFIFADEGYDVWLGNMRGNTYSKQHSRLRANDPAFWKFSWEDMARSDLPAMVNYVLRVTKQPHLYYVGHSQGALTMFSKMSEDQEFSNKIRKFFAMAPVTRMSNVKGLFYDLGQIYEQYNMVYQIFGDGEFLSNNIFTKLFTDILCDQAVNNPLCENFIFAVSGPNSNQFNASRIGIYLAHNPAGTSSRNMLHFAQMVKTQRMARFNFGKQFNLRYYHTEEPPEYDLSRINSSVYLFYSDSDWLANSLDVEGYLMQKLPKNTLRKAKKLKDFNHNDFLWGMRARSEIYEKILDEIFIDVRRLNVQEGLTKFLRSRPSSLPSNFSDEIRRKFITAKDVADFNVTEPFNLKLD